MPVFSSFSDLTVVFSRIAEKSFSSLLCRGEHQVAVGAGSKPASFRRRSLCCEGGVNRSQFQSDVAAADDEQSLRNVGQIESAGRIHEARAVELEAGHDGRTRSGSDDDAVESQILFAARRGLRDFNVVEFTKAALPCTNCTECCLDNCPSPPVSFLTTLSFHPRSLLRSTLGSPNSTPQFWPARLSSSSLATCSSALEGMQPR